MTSQDPGVCRQACGGHGSRASHTGTRVGQEGGLQPLVVFVSRNTSSKAAVKSGAALAVLQCQREQKDPGWTRVLVRQAYVPSTKSNGASTGVRLTLNPSFCDFIFSSF